MQDDDMNEIYDEMHKADVIVLACPVYFYTWTSLMKRMIDRTFAIEDCMDKKVFYLLSAAATRKETNVQTMIKCFRQYIRASEKMKVKRAILYLLIIQEKQRM